MGVSRVAKRWYKKSLRTTNIYGVLDIVFLKFDSVTTITRIVSNRARFSSPSVSNYWLICLGYSSHLCKVSLVMRLAESFTRIIYTFLVSYYWFNGKIALNCV